MTRIPFFALVATIALALSAPVRAQEADSATTPEEAVLQRARRLLRDGRDADGRQILDSVLKANDPESAVYAEALYWRGALAATAADAERDYRRLLIEAPLAPRAEEALLQLAQLEQARGDRRSAADHLQRFMLTYPTSSSRPRVAISLVRLLFEMGPQQQARACEALRLSRDAIPSESIELRNQLDFYSPRCFGEVVAAPPAPPAVPTAPAVADPAGTAAAGQPARGVPTQSAEPPPVEARPTRPAPGSPAPGAKPAAPDRAAAGKSERAEPTAFYSVQVAAYDSPEAARNLVRSLSARGLDARVDGTTRPYRVRVGKYSTRAEAVKVAQGLKAQGQPAFVTLVSGK